MHGALRSLDYQDVAYANEYLDTLDRVVTMDNADRGYALTNEVARQLALQMCYEDTIRVAELKTRSARFARIRQHVAARPDQPVRVIEYFHPRFEEVCDVLPASIGSFVVGSNMTRKILSPFFSSGRNIKTTSIAGFLLLRTLAKLTRFRRGTYRFRKQKAFIGDWLGRIRTAENENYDYAVSIAHCIEIVKGYGATYERGLSRYRATVDAVAEMSVNDPAQAVQRLHQAALADEKGKVFQDALASTGTNT
jgi:indolepyruvate ferredoxin oxidoreductase beta subunit